MDPTDPIRRVSVVSTGQVQIRPDHLASTWRPTFWWLLASRRWTGPRPGNAYVIEDRDGLVLFDAGQDRRPDRPPQQGEAYESDRPGHLRLGGCA